MQSLLIKDTTRAQREEIVRRALSACGSPVSYTHLRAHET